MRRLLLLVLLAVLTACAQQEPLPGKPVDRSPAGRFFAAVASHPETAGSLAVPGSGAGRYVAFQVALQQARRDAHVRLQRTVVRRQGSGYLLCEPGPTPQCARATRILLAGERVRGFAVDGKPIGSRIALAGHPVAAGPAGSVALAAAYEQPTTRSLWVLLTLHTGQAAVTLRPDPADYSQGVDGAGIRAVAATRTASVPAQRRFTVAVVVPGARLGGTLTLHLLVGSARVDVEVPVSR